MDRASLTSEVSSWISGSNNGYFITLNTINKDKISFEQDLSKIAHKLNDYVYGRNYRRNFKRLKIIAGIETGKENGILHAHLVVAHQGETNRQLFDINCYLRRHWYKLIGLNDYDGSMVNIQKIGDSDSRITYILKDTKYWLRNDNLNIIVL